MQGLWFANARCLGEHVAEGPGVVLCYRCRVRRCSTGLVRSVGMIPAHGGDGCRAARVRGKALGWDACNTPSGVTPVTGCQQLIPSFACHLCRG